jgi:hypothetical protein
MSELQEAKEVIEFAKKMVGEQGPIEINVGYDIFTDKGEKYDMYNLGKAGIPISLDDVVEMVTTVYNLFDELDLSEEYPFLFSETPCMDTLSIQFAQEVVGKTGGIQIDTGIYAHNINMDEADKKSDIYILGNVNTDVTFDDVITMLAALDGLVNELELNRTYFLEHMSDVGFLWGS